MDADVKKCLRSSAFICVLILYQPTNRSPYPSGSYAVVPVGSQYANGTWRELRRDLDADLRSVFGVGVEHVLWICIWGDYDLDELTLIGREERSYYYAAGARVAMLGQLAGERTDAVVPVDGPPWDELTVVMVASCRTKQDRPGDCLRAGCLVCQACRVTRG